MIPEQPDEVPIVTCADAGGELPKKEDVKEEDVKKENVKTESKKEKMTPEERSARALAALGCTKALKKGGSRRPTKLRKQKKPLQEDVC